ncbi:hypothetical protein GM672_05245 [Massilia buxea]|uniref:Uncharacterized protein n=1 Tax=Pseudoduganella buxea TaxID=1949069 RepID=A0A6I3SWR1_9BURK|nr:hypothetical protein [Pseudoduganella buxea]
MTHLVSCCLRYRRRASERTCLSAS